MSTNEPQANPSASAETVATEPGATPTPSPWVWMILACILLGASGGVRAWQDYRFNTVQDEVAAPPFPLKELPKTLGDWQFQEGSETSLDPQIARIAGCSDHLIRTYRNAVTGVSVSAMVLFGPAQTVYGHRPEICYPTAGYQPIQETLTRTIPIGSASPAEFSSQVYAKRKDLRRGREEVYYSFRHGDRWTFDPGRFWKEFRHHPSMFKVQIQRRVIESERRELDNPTEAFLALLLPEIERRLPQAPRHPEG